MIIKQLGVLAAAAIVLTATIASTTSNAAAAYPNMRVSPTTTSVAPGGSFSVTVKQNASVTTSAAQADFTFDPNLVQIVSVTQGALYPAANLQPSPMAAAITVANVSGTLANLADFIIPPNPPLPAGDQDFLIIAMQAKNPACGTSRLNLANQELNDAAGNPIYPTVTSAFVTVTGVCAATTLGGLDIDAAALPTSHDSGTTLVLAIIAAGVIAVAGAGTFVVKRRAS
jgi:hypothetical protein